MKRFINKKDLVVQKSHGKPTYEVVFKLKGLVGVKPLNKPYKDTSVIFYLAEDFKKKFGPLKS